LKTSEIILAKPLDTLDHMEQLNREALFHADHVVSDSNSDSA